MILVVASIADEAAASFANEAAASLFTCADLALRPSAIRHPDVLSSTLSIGGQTIRASEIRGVVNVLPIVLPDELAFYPPEERDYQASEIGALLTYLLSALPCRVINRPSASSLGGGCASRLEWLGLARRVGFSLPDAVLDSASSVDPFAGRSGEVRVSRCLDGEIIAPSDADADRMTLALGAKASVDHLRVNWARGERGSIECLGARATPDLSDAATRAAIRRLLS